jgi:hypothetical protein
VPKRVSAVKRSGARIVVGNGRARRINVRNSLEVGEIRRVFDFTIWFERDCDEQPRLFLARWRNLAFSLLNGSKPHNLHEAKP